MPKDQDPLKERRPQQLDGDQPIVNIADDRLGFGEIAEHLAQAFLQNDLSTGFVVGVEGEWGSGKSSLVGMALDQLRKSNSREVIEFQPWLVGHRDELLRELFSQLSTAWKKQNPKSGADTAELFEKFADYASGVGALAGLLGKVGIPGAEIFAGVAQNVAGHAKSQAPSLAEVKRQLVEKLRGLQKPIVVFIDDLDRLDPTEAVEVLRLVRAVADFPNIAYILAYDAGVLAHNLRKALSIKDGHAYIEKIVQVSFRVPTPLDYDLRLQTH